jgi:hypothetical protein
MPHGLTVLIPRTYDGALFEHRLVPDGAVPKGKKKKKTKS